MTITKGLKLIIRSLRDKKIKSERHQISYSNLVDLEASNQELENR